MNRRQKIIVSVTSIFLVLLILLGLTYAYFLTRITGNSNTTSIKVETAYLSLTYGDGNGVLEAANKIKPGEKIEFYQFDDEDEIITKTDESGNTVPDLTSTKTFTVTNDGDTEVTYAVTFETIKVYYANSGVDENGNPVTKGDLTNFKLPEGLKLHLSCTSSDTENNCDGYDASMPATEDILRENSIAPGVVHSYSLSMDYLDDGDQSVDMNKTFEFKVDIIDPKATTIIEGNVANAADGDFIETHSTPKQAYLDKDGNFKVVGLEYGEHDVFLKNMQPSIIDENTGEVTYSEETKSSTTINVEKGEIASGTGTNATVTETENKVTMSIDASSNAFSITGVSNDKDDYAVGTPTYHAQKGDLQVGDYILYEYTPNTYTTNSVDDYGTSQSFDSESTNAIASNKWRVISIDDEVVQIMPDIRTVPKLTIDGASGWINGEKVLNEMTRTLYSGPYGTARSINIGDINKKVQYTGKHSYYLNGSVYSTELKTLNELEEAVNTREGTNYSIESNYRINPDGTSADNMKISYYTYWLFNRDTTSNAEYNRTLIANPLTTDWTGTGKTVEFEMLALYTFTRDQLRTNFVNMIPASEIETYTESPYWLASRANDVSFDNREIENEDGTTEKEVSLVKYGMRFLGAANVSRRHMWNAQDCEVGAPCKLGENSATYGVVPIVTLASDLQIKKENGKWKINS